eukprot:CAMPEP_0180609498 /NCGR_PEP_ID=MMETSP1037_2-20121125/28787_1 /TAXON_ID=632150 /ORGANISM="Azadinium spinosum, Strain 3D9" /LENGTH=164 /DNA_ID=CAMNT_0022628891 /DNA_START=305 /DNA_END=799 /DNA_ORIENTATION=-
MGAPSQKTQALALLEIPMENLAFVIQEQQPDAALPELLQQARGHIPDLSHPDFGSNSEPCQVDEVASDARLHRTHFYCYYGVVAGCAVHSTTAILRSRIPPMGNVAEALCQPHCGVTDKGPTLESDLRRVPAPRDESLFQHRGLRTPGDLQPTPRAEREGLHGE